MSDGNRNKGIDDALAGGVTPDVLRNGEAAKVIDEIAAAAQREGQTDLGNARRLVRYFGDNLRHVGTWNKWLAYDGRRWERDETGRVERFAKATIRRMHDEASQLRARGATKAADALADWARSSEFAPRVYAMIALATTEPSVSITHRDLDADGWLLNCQNGTLDLRTGELRPHCRHDLITKVCPTPYHPNAESDLWATTLAKIFGGDFEMVAYLQRLTGYGITGVVRESILPVHWGTGSNGKSVVFEVLQAVIGSDYASAGSRDLLRAEESAHPTFLADLFGRRLVTLAETAEGGRLNEALVKQLTGRDTVKARQMRQDFWEFAPSHKLWVATNHPPKVRGNDEGIWRRLRLIPYRQRFWDAGRGESGLPEWEADRTLPDRLKAEAEAAGILAWAVRGCVEWQTAGLRDPKGVLAATNDYRREQDTLQQFLDARTRTVKPPPVARHALKARDLYEAYRSWHEAGGEDGKPMSQRRLGEALREKGFERDTSNGVRYPTLELCPVDEMEVKG